MKTALKLFALLVAVLAAAYWYLVIPAPAPEHRIFINGQILSMDEDNRIFEAMSVRGDRIHRLGTRAEIEELAGEDTVITDLGGNTLLPGFVDAHTHTFSRAYIKIATGAGVTTQLDMFTSLDVMRPLKAEQERGEARDRADLFSSGTLVTAPGGRRQWTRLPRDSEVDSNRISEPSGAIASGVSDRSFVSGECEWRGSVVTPGF